MTPIYDMKNGKWSDLQKECYERNCNCRGCEYSKYSTKCRVKYSLMEKIKIFGVESGVETKQWLQNIDNWLFRGGDDNKECEPEINADGSITCKCCSNVDCEYWSEFNSEVEK